MEDREPRKAHWVKFNHQNRVPGRWIAFDTESYTLIKDKERSQFWRVGAAVRWRMGLKGGDYAERQHFSTPEKLWQWVTDYCRPGERTVVTCHNLGYDVRISEVMDILPKLGWHLDWCNLGSTVSSMTWRGPRGTLVFSDLFTWLPMPLESIGELVGQPKMGMPTTRAKIEQWRKYCLNDAEIVYLAVKEITGYIKSQNLGNWQPTGAGMSYATWRHKFMTHRVLVHDDETALEAERKAMHTGRAEAWRHGELTDTTWVEVDLKQAYTQIAAAYDLPTKLKWHNGPISLSQYRELIQRYAVLAHVSVRTDVPVVPCHHGDREIWPTGEFDTWLWDSEIDALAKRADSIRIRECYVYTKAPILSDWAHWVLRLQGLPDEVSPPVIKKWVKHSGRTLIGRIALRTSQWAVWGGNPDGRAGISHMVDTESGKVSRMMHAGDRTFVEEGKSEGRDSLPQVTGYIMSVCRVWLWNAMEIAGTENIAHVDTDSLIVNIAGLERLYKAYGEGFAKLWQIKSTYDTMHVYGPRNYRGDGIRKVSGVSKRAREVEPNLFVGERWASMAGDMANGVTGSVSMYDHTWHAKATDPRRMDAAGAGGFTQPVRLDHSSNVSPSVSAVSTPGA